MNKKVKGKKESKFSFDKEFPKMTDTICLINNKSSHGISQIGCVLKNMKIIKL